MSITPAYIGEATHRTRCGTFRWRPAGPVYTYSPAGGASAPQARDIEDFGEGGAEGARLFVGFNVGGEPTWTLQQVADAVYDIRKAQGAGGDASLLLQRGIYESSAGAQVNEDSAQIVILNLSGEPDFTSHMLQLGESLRERLHQERVIIEIQQGGVVKHVYSATDPKVLNSNA